MRNPLKNQAKKILKKFDIAITRHSRLQQLERESNQKSKADNVMDLFLNCADGYNAQLLTALRRSKSQLGQDLFVLCELSFKAGGYFVEFGAANGVDLSNTYLLEKEFGWSGIVAEPAKRWHRDLMNSRECHIETDCVWRESNAVVDFNEAGAAEYSTIDSYSSSDHHSLRRKNGTTYSVKTISLKDLLDKYEAPRKIDYLSIDTEGSEYEILSGFDFSKYQFSVITCEHNYTQERAKIFSLLSKNGYLRKLEAGSGFDDWYVKSE
jgi:FkbM family methyltransferase